MSGESFFGKESLQSRLTIAEEAISVLEKLVSIPENELLSNAIYMFATKGAFLIFLQAILDLGNYIIADRELGVPSSYEDLLDILGSHKVLSEKGREKIKELLKMRDRILHSSEMTPFKVLLDTVKENMEFFKELLTAIRSQLLSIGQTK